MQRNRVVFDAASSQERRVPLYGRPVRGLGTVVNVATVIVGTGVGVAFGARIPERVRDALITAIGLVTLAVGVSGFLETRNAVFPIVALVLGGALGAALRLEERLEGLGERLRLLIEHRLPRRADASESTFVVGFVTATLTFCVGALTIVGSLQDGISGDSQLLLVKAALDGVISVVFATAFGIGVGFSALSVAVLQGTVTLAGVAVGEALSERMAAELEATGGVMVLGIGLRLLDLKQVPVGSYLPALAMAPVLVALFAR